MRRGARAGRRPARPPRGAKAPTIRIGSGRWKGRRLEAPPGARPTSAKAREALFDILQKRIPGARVLELYAGSGAVGLEAVSRGAARALLVEPAADALERNLGRLGPDPGRVELLRGEASAALVELARRGERFDIVFADPPYRSGPAPDIGPGVAGLLAAGGIFVLQGDVGQEVLPSGLRLRERRAYGRNILRFFEPDPSGAGGSGGGASF